MDQIVVVGASLAGIRACQNLRREGFEGSLTLIGAEKHHPYDRPPLSKTMLATDQAPEELLLMSEDALSALDLTLMLGEPATSLDVGRQVLASESAQNTGTKEITTAEIPSLAPQLNLDGVVSATYQPRAGYADPVMTTRTLIEQASRHGLSAYEGIGDSVWIVYSRRAALSNDRRRSCSSMICSVYVSSFKRRPLTRSPSSVTITTGRLIGRIDPVGSSNERRRAPGDR